MSEQPAEITNTQARVIYEVAKEHGYWVSKSFTPQELYANDNRARLALQELTLMGLVAMEPMAWETDDLRHVVIGKDGKQYRLRITMPALAAYDRWVAVAVDLARLMLGEHAISEPADAVASAVADVVMV